MSSEPGGNGQGTTNDMVSAGRILTLTPIVMAAGVLPALAHPHVFIDAKETLVFDAGKLAAIDHVWQFDEAFSAFATQGLDANNDGKLSAAELAPLAKVNVDSLSDFAFFSYLTIDGKRIDFKAPTQYHLEYDGQKLTLFYTLTLKAPVAITGQASLEVFDPEYFVAFMLTDTGIILDHSPPGCKSDLQLPHQLDAQTMAVLASIPVDQQVLPPDLVQKASLLANVITVSCGSGPLPAAATPNGAGSGASQATTKPSSATLQDGDVTGGLSSDAIAKIASVEAARVASGQFAQ